MSRDPLHERALAAVRAQQNRTAGAPPWAGRKVVIYGAGAFGRDVAAALSRQGAALLGFLDRNGAGREIAPGLRSFRLDSPQARGWLAEKPVAVIGVFNFAASIREIRDTLTAAGFSSVLTPMDIYPHLRAELGWRYWMGFGGDYAGAEEPIERALALWADAESRRLFLETLVYRLENDPAMLTVISPPDTQYADPTAPRWSAPLRVVDGGAYQGEGTRILAAQKYAIDSVYAFEPDAANFRQLRANVAALGGAKISLWPCGLWSSSGRLAFAEGGGSGSRLSESGTASVPVVALDDALIGQPVNLIKLDVEGAEPEALRGARGIIERDRPGLAVCVYHYPRHLWEIPLWVADLELDYRLHYRVHQQNSFDAVLYAVPR